MAFTAASRRKGTRTKQENRRAMGDPFLRLANAGERARAAGLPASACPYAEGDEDHDSWMFGWEGLDD